MDCPEASGHPNESWPVLDALEPVLHDGGQLAGLAAGAEVAQAVLHVRPGALDRVELRGISASGSLPRRVPANLSKLARPGAPVRHLFALFPGFNPAPITVNDLLIAPDAPIPTIAPVPPPEVTKAFGREHLEQCRWLQWSPVTGWTRFIKVEPQ